MRRFYTLPTKTGGLVIDGRYSHEDYFSLVVSAPLPHYGFGLGEILTVKKIRVKKEEKYYVPHSISDSDGTTWRYLGHGSYNAAYHSKNALVKKFPIYGNSPTSTDFPKRLERVGKQLYEKRNSKMVMRADADGTAFTMSFIPSKKDATGTSSEPSADDIRKEMLEIFKSSKRIVVDALTPGNFIKQPDGTTICVDFGFALLFSDPTDPEHSQVSLATWNYYVKRYINYLDKYMTTHGPDDGMDYGKCRLYQIARFTKALIFLAVSGLQLHNLDELLKNPPLVAELSDFFDLKKETLDDQFEELFTAESIAKFTKRNDELNAFSNEHSLSLLEKQILFLNPSCEFEKNFIIKCDYFKISPEERASCFLNPNVEEREMFLKKSSYEHFLQLCASNTNTSVSMKNKEPEYHIYYDAMLSLIEQNKVSANDAYNMLAGTTPTMAKIIGRCYQFDLRREYFPQNFSSSSDQHIDQLVCIFKKHARNGKKLSETDFHAILSKSEHELRKEVQLIAEEEHARKELEFEEGISREWCFSDVGFFKQHKTHTDRAHPQLLSDDFPDDTLDPQGATTPSTQLLAGFSPT